MNRNRAGLALALSAGLLVAACSSSTSNSNSSSSSSSSSTASSSESASSSSASSSAPVSSSAASSAPSSAMSGSTASSMSSASSGSVAPSSSSGDNGTTIPSGALANTGKTIDIMGFSTNDEVGTSRVDLAKKVDSKLDIKVDQNGFDPQKFATAMNGGTVPAGVYMDRNLIAEYAQKGYLTPLDDCVSKDAIDTNQYYKEAIEESTYNGHLYGIPDFYTVTAILMNNKVLSASGVAPSDIDTSNWDNLLTVAKKMYKATNGKPSTIGYDPKIPEYLPLWAAANGGSIISSDGKPTLNDPKVVEALKYTVSLVNAQGGWANFKSFRDTWDFFGAKNEFAANQIGAMDFENWYPNVLFGFPGSQDLSAAAFKGRDGQPLSLEAGASFTIPDGSPNAGGMCEFMKLATSEAAWEAAGAARSAKLATTNPKGIFTGLFTANQTANAKLQAEYVKPSGNAKIDAVIKVYYNALSSAKMVPPSPAGVEIQTAYEQAVTEALNGKDPQQALDTAQSTATDAYNDAMS